MNHSTFTFQMHHNEERSWRRQWWLAWLLTLFMGSSVLLELLLGLALSFTAVVLRNSLLVLQERGGSTPCHGRATFCLIFLGYSTMSM
ncbi:hypothetical protein LWI28_017970 [Acer negundo]|uniref:Uncharacterized protein n=1 Tax=Acer negundo TaxID=4023 RepID=A0AAD5JTK4_ACENE|nr:hypothetical protein LWI28_017970 [Acer negundo]